MGETFIEMASAVSERWDWAALVPLLAGGAIFSRLAPWLPSEKDLDLDVNLTREVLAERIAGAWRLADGAVHPRVLVAGDSWVNTADVLAELGKAIMRAIVVWEDICRFRTNFRFWNGLLLATIIGAILAQIAGLALEGSGLIVGTLAFILFAVQIIATVLSRRAHNRVKEYGQRI